jgi:hypothetical protein
MNHTLYPKPNITYDRLLGSPLLAKFPHWALSSLQAAEKSELSSILKQKSA